MVGFLARSSGQGLDIQLLVLAKDGTLLDFDATWAPGFKECARRVAIAAGEPALEPALLKAGGLIEGEAGVKVSSDAVMRRGTLREVAQRWMDTQPIVAAHWSEVESLVTLMQEVCSQTADLCTTRAHDNPPRS